MESSAIIIFSLLFFCLLVYFAKKKKTTTNGVRGKGSMPNPAAWDPNAQIINIQTEDKIFSAHGGLRTVVTFSDGYTFTTYYSKLETKVKLTGASNTYTVDAECREMICTAAIAAHNQKS